MSDNLETGPQSIEDVLESHLSEPEEPTEAVEESPLEGNEEVEAAELVADAEEVEEIDFDGNSFCFTGTFLYGTRTACHKATESAGGIAAKGITKKLDYLVIGTNTTESWANTSFGRKIEKAVDYRDSGVPLAIISEACWINHLPASDE